jgi:hypothetical protein
MLPSVGERPLALLATPAAYWLDDDDDNTPSSVNIRHDSGTFGAIQGTFGVIQMMMITSLLANLGC